MWENSGESSGFEEMFLDKELVSLKLFLLILNVKEFFIVVYVIVSDIRFL